MSNTVDERITQIEKDISFYKGAFWLATGIFVALAAFTNWIILPSAAVNALEEELSTENRQLIDDAVQNSKRINQQIARTYEPITSKGTKREFLIKEKHLL